MPEAMRVPFVDLTRQFHALEPELTQAFLQVGRNGTYILGEALEKFESSAAAYCEVSHAVGVADGSAALFLMLKASGIGLGDEVITVPNSFIATAWTIVATGARPVFVDVGTDMNLDPSRIEGALTPRTRAIIPVHLTGRPADMDAINDIATRRDLAVFEDAAQALGARYRGKRAGSLSLGASFSMHPVKNLGVYGDGGIITTNDRALAEKLRLLRNHGLRNRDEVQIWGYNSRLDTLQASFASIKLKHLDQWNARHRKIAARYRAGLEAFVEVPEDKPWEECIYHNFVIRTDRRDAMMEHLKKCGVDTRIHYPIPIHLQEAARGLGYQLGDFPNAESDARRMISLPIYPELSDDEIEHVISAVRSFSN
jgi:dTDP-4-amino-4,6-dideoxygalactose transaminase